MKRKPNPHEQLISERAKALGLTEPRPSNYGPLVARVYSPSKDRPPLIAPETPQHVVDEIHAIFDKVIETDDWLDYDVELHFNPQPNLIMPHAVLLPRDLQSLTLVFRDGDSHIADERGDACFVQWLKPHKSVLIPRIDRRRRRLQAEQALVQVLNDELHEHAGEERNELFNWRWLQYAGMLRSEDVILEQMRFLLSGELDGCCGCQALQ